jgi:hypothetical protein
MQVVEVHTVILLVAQVEQVVVEQEQLAQLEAQTEMVYPTLVVVAVAALVYLTLQVLVVLAL